MKARLFGCRKYRKISYAQRDRELTGREAEYLDKHSAVCQVCRNDMGVAFAALQMLQGEALEPICRPQFEDRVIRRFRVENAKAKIGYWSPAVLGAAVAGLVLLAALQMIAQSGKLPAFRVPGGEARLSNPAFPSALPNSGYQQFINQ